MNSVGLSAHLTVAAFVLCNLIFLTFSTRSKTIGKFLSSFGYFDKAMKMEMMSAMDKKQLLGQFMTDLNAKIATQKKARDDNRKRIQEMASKILENERAKYSKAFKTERGNVCQKFQL